MTDNRPKWNPTELNMNNITIHIQNFVYNVNIPFHSITDGETIRQFCLFINQNPEYWGNNILKSLIKPGFEYLGLYPDIITKLEL